VTTGPGKSWNLGGPFSGPRKSWKTAQVMESHGKGALCHGFYGIFTTALRNSVMQSC